MVKKHNVRGTCFSLAAGQVRGPSFPAASERPQLHLGGSEGTCVHLEIPWGFPAQGDTSCHRQMVPAVRLSLPSFSPAASGRLQRQLSSSECTCEDIEFPLEFLTVGDASCSRQMVPPFPPRGFRSYYWIGIWVKNHKGLGTFSLAAGQLWGLPFQLARSGLSGLWAAARSFACT